MNYSGFKCSIGIIVNSATTQINHLQLKVREEKRDTAHTGVDTAAAQSPDLGWSPPCLVNNDTLK